AAAARAAIGPRLHWYNHHRPTAHSAVVHPSAAAPTSPSLTSRRRFPRSPPTVDWVRQAEVDGGQRPGMTTADQQRIVELEREGRELRRANEILKAGGAFWWRSSPRPERGNPDDRSAGGRPQGRADLPGPSGA